MTTIRRAVLAGIAGLTISAGAAGAGEAAMKTGAGATPVVVPARPEIYSPFTLSADLSGLTDDERRFRYKVLRVVVPLINVIWADV